MFVVNSLTTPLPAGTQPSSLPLRIFPTRDIGPLGAVTCIFRPYAQRGGLMLMLLSGAFEQNSWSLGVCPSAELSALQDYLGDRSVRMLPSTALGR